MPEMKTPFEGAVSIARYISTSGFCSYQDAVRLFTTQSVFLNEHAVTEFWLPVNPKADVVRVNESVISTNQDKKYFAFHKPVGYISSHSGKEGFPTIYDLLNKRDINCWLTTAGRLDVDTSGLMILTNDTKFIRELSHPETKISKVYELTLDGIYDDQHLHPVREGVVLGNGYTCLPAEYEIIPCVDDLTTVRLTLTEGKKRQIRRMCKVLRLNLKTLKRIQMGKYSLGNLNPGEYVEIKKSDII